MDLDLLKSEREGLKRSLRELEVEAREADAKVKSLRQQELRTRREIEALTTLIDLQDESRDEPKEEPG